MCGEKQSFRKIFAQGSGKECRQVVQKLNMISGNLKRRMLEGNVENSSETTGRSETRTLDACLTNEGNDSKWNQFLSHATGKYYDHFILTTTRLILLCEETIPQDNTYINLPL